MITKSAARESKDQRQVNHWLKVCCMALFAPIIIIVIMITLIICVFTITVNICITSCTCSRDEKAVNTRSKAGPNQAQNLLTKTQNQPCELLFGFYSPLPPKNRLRPRQLPDIVQVAAVALLLFWCWRLLCLAPTIYF